jgi:AcrB/AcrD/AcrF family/Outer membrane efflux protein
MSPRVEGGRFVRGRRLAEAILAGVVVARSATVFAEGPATPPVLSIDEAVSRALSSNRVLASAVLDVSRAEEKMAAAKSSRWPTLSLNVLASRLLTPIDFEFEKGVFGDFPGIGPTPAEDTKVGSPRGFTTLGLGQLQFPLSQQYEIGLNVRLNKNLVQVLAISVAMIFLALVLQFRSAVKPLIVFGAIPYGMVGGIAALSFMREPFGFMGFLGMVSLVGVIVSHVIVLFDFIEEKHAEGEPLEQALLDAGIIRLRPVLITVGATVIALIPLAMHGGPL